MITSKVTFEQDNQKIIIDFEFDEETGSLEYKPRFEPPVDPKTPLGLMGQLCEIFIQALHNTDNPEDTEIEYNESTEQQSN